MNLYGFFVKIFFPFVKFYWFVFRPKSYGVKCVVYGDNEVLMIRNNYGTKLWTFPGGGIEKGETTEEAARREVMEEVGIALGDIKQIGQFESDKQYKKDTITVFAGEVIDKNFKITSGEILDGRWFSLSDLPQLSEYGKKMLDMWRR